MRLLRGHLEFQGGSKMPPAKIFKNYINGEWVPSASGRTYDNVNPACRGELVGVFQKSNQQDVADAIEAATDAYKTWRLTPPPKRGEILFRAARLLGERKEDLRRADDA